MNVTDIMTQYRVTFITLGHIIGTADKPQYRKVNHSDEVNRRVIYEDSRSCVIKRNVRT